ncbi:MAG: hypothetical protein N4A48_02035 [Tepidibacter sp.]|uniref:hypothetical protein n=1 Tax=Tepidibacter sp. TaxID=2529387 RepID=UPI0025CC0D53|nr:hypothetical protein [Tepidibacter sp.]MCT4507535.1 hypothetical protein [Tepidibacter sp.]
MEDNKMMDFLIQMNDNINKRFDNIENDIKDMKSEVKSIDKRLTKVELFNEEINSNTKLALEGISMNKEINERQHKEIIDNINSKTDVIKDAVEDLSIDIEFIKQKEYKNEQNIFKLNRKIL